MTKIDIINRVAETTGLSKQDADMAVETIIALVKESLSRDEEVILRRFGSFQTKAKRPRVGRNPKTGEEAEITARTVVRFKAGKRFKQMVDGQPVDED
ncbi:MAG: HU family DNA-binding protein [Nitrospinae bacterium]|nr:HU family DNA-binding protein [Nitrospinota bacterium]